MSAVLISEYSEPKISEKEIFRYIRASADDEATRELVRDALAEVRAELSYRVCYRELSVTVCDEVCDFGIFKAHSRLLAKNLRGCTRAVLFAATVGHSIDRKIMKFSAISPLRSLAFQAIGSERVEALCNEFESEVSMRYKSTRPRFSPGYGDLSLELQRDIFEALDPQKHLGIFLRESLLMTPSKSVTAFIGIAE